MCTNVVKVFREAQAGHRDTHSQMAAIFDKVLAKYTQNLLAQIALDFNLPKEELEIKFMGPKKSVDPSAQCTVITAKKTRCTRKCLDGQSVCGVHSKKAEPVFIRKDDPGPSLSVDDRIKAIMDADESEDEEPSSPGGVRHALFLKYQAQGVTWDRYYSQQWPSHLQTLEERLQFLATQPFDPETV